MDQATTDLFNGLIGDCVKIFDTVDFMENFLSDTRTYNASSSTHTISVVSITPIPKVYKGTLGNLTINVDVTGVNITGVNGVHTTGQYTIPNDTSLPITLDITAISYLVQFNIDVKS